VREQVQLWLDPLLVKEQVWPIVGHDQKPSSWTTCGQTPFGPAACGIAWPSGVCAALMIASALVDPLEPPLPVVVGGGLGGGGGRRRCLSALSFCVVSSAPAVPGSVPSMPPQPMHVSTNAPAIPPNNALKTDRLIALLAFPRSALFRFVTG
jgi:hypothetical protein